MIDLHALEQALLVLDQGSFRKAAALLGVRPSVVSRRVRALEDAIGVSLFQRQSQGAQPTLVGRAILLRGRVIIDEIGHLLRTAHVGGDGSEGSLCIGVVSSIASGTARELLRAFVSAHPAVDLQIVEGAPREHISAVRALKMDVSFVVVAHRAGMRNRAAVERADLYGASGGSPADLPRFRALGSSRAGAVHCQQDGPRPRDSRLCRQEHGGPWPSPYHRAAAGAPRRPDGARGPRTRDQPRRGSRSQRRLSRRRLPAARGRDAALQRSMVGD